MNGAVRFDLGGVGRGGEWQTVNLVGDPDVRCDILEVERYAAIDGSVDAFRLSHTLEHVPSERYVEFVLRLRRKLRTGGTITVIQTDAAEVINQWKRGELSFRAMRATLFTPADRLRANPYNRHHQMWSQEELAADFQALGFDAESFEAGSWRLDMTDDLIPDAVEAFHGVEIRNLGVTATKPAIPRVIHQTWKDSDVPESIFPREWIESWRDHAMQDFEYRLWTDADNRALIAEHYPWFLDTYDRYDVPIKRVDAARYFILHRFGGIYADLDFVRLRSLDPLLARNDLVLAYESRRWVGNALMGCSPGHPVMDEAIRRLEGTADRHVLEATGPRFLTRILEESAYLEEILPADFIYPYGWDDPRKAEYAECSIESLRQRFPNAYTATHWTASWH